MYAAEHVNAQCEVTLCLRLPSADADRHAMRLRSEHDVSAEHIHSLHKHSELREFLTWHLRPISRSKLQDRVLSQPSRAVPSLQWPWRPRALLCHFKWHPQSFQSRDRCTEGRSMFLGWGFPELRLVTSMSILCTDSRMLKKRG